MKIKSIVDVVIEKMNLDGRIKTISYQDSAFLENSIRNDIIEIRKEYLQKSNNSLKYIKDIHLD